MKRCILAFLLSAAAALAIRAETVTVTATLSSAPGNESHVVEKLAWFGTLESARAEAARTNRPIFLLAARPCAGGVPGFW